MTSVKSYAFIQIANENIDGIKRLKLRILMNDSDPDQFIFQHYRYLPLHLSDDFSRGFQDSATRLGQGILITEAINSEITNA